MKKTLIIIAALVAATIASAAIFTTWYLSRFATDPESNPVDVQTKRQLASGEIMGFLDNGSYAWLGIPYAEPPVGPLRWRAPRPVQSWQVPRAAVEFGHKCPQTSFSGEVEGAEDCLFLNVWAPMQADTPRPVMLFIHGGGNHIGESGTPIYRGARFAREQDVVLVSINYRLGPLGWFRHAALRNDTKAPPADATKPAEPRLASLQAQADTSGNFATLDIIQALVWVQTNIAQFGGDANNVTIFGESAGGFNVLSLMVSPLAEGLYHKAIVQSGGLTLVSQAEAENYRDADIPGHPMSSRELVNQLLINAKQASDRDSAKRLQKSQSLESTSAFLRSQTAEQILLAQNNQPAAASANTTELSVADEEPTPFVLGQGTPQRTPYIFGDGYVLPAGAQLDTLLTDPATYNATPVMLGSNRDETRLFLSFSPGYISTFMGIPLRLSDVDLYQRDSQYGSNLWKADAVDELAILLRQTQGSGVYAYRFDWDEFRSVMLLDMKTVLGAAHALELPFVFGNFGLVNKTLLFKDGAARKKLSQAMMSYWAEFAYSGAPGQGRNGDLPLWQPWPAATDDAAATNPNRVLLLDSENDGGIRMAPDLATRATIATDLAADTRFSEAQRCHLAKRLFTGRYSDSPDSIANNCP